MNTVDRVVIAGPRQSVDHCICGANRPRGRRVLCEIAEARLYRSGRDGNQLLEKTPVQGKCFNLPRIDHLAQIRRSALHKRRGVTDDDFLVDRAWVQCEIHARGLLQLDRAPGCNSGRESVHLGGDFVIARR